MNRKKAFSLIELSIVILIIGIIIAGITQGSRLIDAHRLSSAQNFTESSPVASISDLALWLEASSQKSFNEDQTSDGSSVSPWKNINPQQIGLNSEASQSDSAKRPTYAAKAINNLPALSFDGTSQFLDIPYDASLNSNAFSIFAVVKPISVDAVYRPILSSRSDGSSVKGYVFYIVPAGSSGGYYRLWVGNGTAWKGQTSWYPFTANNSELISITYADPDYTMYFPKSGTSYTDSFTITTQSTQIFRIGAALNISETSPTMFFKGYIGELIIFSRKLKSEERISVEDYLKKKWGI